MTDFLVRPSPGSAIARPKTYLNIVIDESSSMEPVTEQTVAAYNAFIESQRHDRIDELFVTLTKFSDVGRVRVVYKALPIAQVPVLTERQYSPDGNTALYDGVFATLKALDKITGPGDRLLTVVITDGDDNQSREVRTADELRRIIEARTARGNHTFVFLAANIDAFRAGASMGFARGNTQTYTADDMGEALATISKGVTGYRHGDQMQTSEFYAAPKWRRTTWATGPEATEDV